MFSDEAGVDLVHEVPIFRNKSVLSVNILDKLENSIKYTRRIFFDFGITNKKMAQNPLKLAITLLYLFFSLSPIAVNS